MDINVILRLGPRGDAHGIAREGCTRILTSTLISRLVITTRFSRARVTSFTLEKRHLVFFIIVIPRMRTRAASRSPRVRRMGRIPMQRTKVLRGPQPPRTKVPSREPPYRTRPPGSTPTSAAGLRLWRTHRPRTSVPATSRRRTPLK